MPDTRVSTSIEFPLLPFGGREGTDGTLPIQVHAFAHRAAGGIRLVYVMRGEVDQITLPEHSGSPERRDRLWERTCFEAFFELEQSSRYLELNLSPAGDWNLYRFDDYRAGMRPENEIQVAPARLSRTNDALIVEASISLPPHKVSRIGLSAVILTTKSDRPHFLAIRHPGEKPDFHLREGWAARF